MTSRLSMKNWTAQRVAEAIALIAVIGSLIFIGMELRQNSIATRAATNSSISDGFIELNLTMASSPELARAFAANADNPAAAPLEDQVLMLGLTRALFHIWSNTHRQHLNGTLDPAIYDAVVQEISSYAAGDLAMQRNPELFRRHQLMRWAWESEHYIYNPEFQLFVDGILSISR